jgi:hypothetical protein
MSDEQKLPKNTAELLSQIEAEWSALMDVVNKLDERQMITPDAGGWSPKDNLAHISEWLKFMLVRHMGGHTAHDAMGVAPEVIANWDTDRINQVFFERNRDRSTEEVLGELKKLYASTMDRLASTPFEDMLKPPHWADQADNASLLELGILNNTRDHFAEHRETMEKGLARKSGA